MKISIDPDGMESFCIPIGRGWTIPLIEITASGLIWRDETASWRERKISSGMCVLVTVNWIVPEWSRRTRKKRFFDTFRIADTQPQSETSFWRSDSFNSPNKWLLNFEFKFGAAELGAVNALENVLLKIPLSMAVAKLRLRLGGHFAFISKNYFCPYMEGYFPVCLNSSSLISNIKWAAA